MRRSVFEALVEIASDHHGYVTTLQARELGIDPTQLRLLAGRGRLEHVARGVYRVPVLPRSAHDDLAVAVAWARGRAVISHESALVLHGLSDVHPAVVHVSAPRDNYPRAQGRGRIRVHRRDLRPADVTVADGLPVTTIARTVEDCLEFGTDLGQLRLAVQQAWQSGALKGGAANRLLERLSSGAQIPQTWPAPDRSPRRIVSPVDLGFNADVDALAAICNRYGIAELAVFGSAATGRMTDESDVDVLYVLRDGVHLGWAVNDLSDDLTALLGRRVDLVAKQGLHARLRDSVLAEAQVLYAA